MLDQAALDVTTTKAGGVGDRLVFASGVNAEMATVDKVVIREAEIQADRDRFRVSPAAMPVQIN
jgi:hypothetical protein